MLSKLMNVKQICNICKETKGRSRGQTPFTIKPKQLALKKQIFNPPRILPNLKNKKIIFAHENMNKQPSKVANNSQPAFFFITGLAPQKAHFRQK
jgi:hypothetical protein